VTRRVWGYLRAPILHRQVNPEMSPQTSQDDVVTLLVAQHERIRSLFEEVDKTAGRDAKQARFEELRRLLAVHETAEELIVHPEARHADGGSEVVDARLREEHDAKELLAELDGMKVTDPEFLDRLALLRQAVLDHAGSEEREEFPLLRQNTNEKTLARMASAVRAAEAMAPTHPHPGVESMTANLMAGPIASVVDRTRDAVRAVLGRD
jgi:hemerythrin superfamily protein